MWERPDKYFGRNMKMAYKLRRQKIAVVWLLGCLVARLLGLATWLALPDLARLPGLLRLGSAELVLPRSLPCFALPRPPTSLIRESTKKGGRRRRPPPFVEVAEGHLPYEACWRPRQGKARQTARQDQLSRAKAKQARQPSQIEQVLASLRAND